MRNMKYSKITSIFITVLLIGHVLIVISYGTVALKYLKYSRDSPVVTQGVSNFTSGRSFPYWFFGAKMNYSYKYKDDGFEKESCFLVFDFAKMNIKGVSDRSSQIEVFNKKTKEKIEIETSPSSIVLPISKEKESTVHLLYSIFGIILIFYSFLVFYILKRILDSTKKGSPFIANNVRHLRQIALLIFILPLILIMYEVAIYFIISFKYIFINSFISPSFKFNLGLFIGGILLLFISETFKQGVRIREEQELTI